MHGGILEVSTRSAKLRRGSYRLSQIQDIAGVRIAVADIPAQEKALGLLADALSGERVTDYRDEPQSGYRAIHLIVGSPSGPLVELQLRTELQDIWANTCETLAGMLDLGIKYGGGPGWVRDALDELSRSGQSTEGLQKYRELMLQEMLTSAADKQQIARTVAIAKDFEGFSRAFLESYTQAVRELVWRAEQQRHGK